MGNRLMTYGLLSSGVDLHWLTSRCGHLMAFSRWSLERQGDQWPVVGQIFDQESISRWWLRDGEREPCWDARAGCKGAGTALAEALQDRDGEARLVVASVIDFQGEGSESCVLAAWNWMLEFPLDHLIFPLGCPDGQRELWDGLRLKSLCRGVTLWAAAGAHPSLPGTLEGIHLVADTLLDQEEGLVPSWRPRITHWVEQEKLQKVWGLTSTGLAAVWACTENLQGTR